MVRVLPTRDDDLCHLLGDTSAPLAHVSAQHSCYLNNLEWQRYLSHPSKYVI